MAAHGLGPAAFSALMALNGLGVVVLQPLVGPSLRAARRRAAPRALRAPVRRSASAMNALVGTSVASATGPLPIYVAGVALWTLGEVVGFPVAATLVANLAPVALRGRYQGAFSMAWGVAFTLSPLLGGEVLTRFGARALWLGCLALGLGVALGHLAAAGPRRRRSRPAIWTALRQPERLRRTRRSRAGRRLRRHRPSAGEAPSHAPSAAWRSRRPAWASHGPESMGSSRTRAAAPAGRAEVAPLRARARGSAAGAPRSARSLPRGGMVPPHVPRLVGPAAAPPRRAAPRRDAGGRGAPALRAFAASSPRAEAVTAARALCRARRQAGADVRRAREPRGADERDVARRRLALARRARGALERRPPGGARRRRRERRPEPRRGRLAADLDGRAGRAARDRARDRRGGAARARPLAARRDEGGRRGLDPRLRLARATAPGSRASRPRSRRSAQASRGPTRRCSRPSRRPPCRRASTCSPARIRGALVLAYQTVMRDYLAPAERAEYEAGMRDWLAAQPAGPGALGGARGRRRGREPGRRRAQSSRTCARQGAGCGISSSRAAASTRRATGGRGSREVACSCRGRGAAIPARLPRASTRGRHRRP